MLQHAILSDRMAGRLQVQLKRREMLNSLRQYTHFANAFFNFKLPYFFTEYMKFKSMKFNGTWTALLTNKRYRPCESFGLPGTNFYETYRCSVALCEYPFTLNYGQSDKNVKSKDSNSPTTLRYSTAFTETIYTRSAAN